MTTDEQISRLKFPIGPFTANNNIGIDELHSLIATIESAPRKYRDISSKLDEEDLRKTYREGSWNVAQVIHHVADMQLLHFFRMKRALTEPDYKEVTLVNQDGWTQTQDGVSAPIEDSLEMFEGITKRYVYLMKSLTAKQLEISWYHPVRKITLNQRQAIAMSAWHVKHHYEHLKIALGRS